MNRNVKTTNCSLRENNMLEVLDAAHSGYKEKAHVQLPAKS